MWRFTAAWRWTAVLQGVMPIRKLSDQEAAPFVHVVRAGRRPRRLAAGLRPLRCLCLLRRLLGWPLCCIHLVVVRLGRCSCGWAAWVCGCRLPPLMLLLPLLRLRLLCLYYQCRLCIGVRCIVEALHLICRRLWLQDGGPQRRLDL